MISEPTTARHILRELPRKRVALVLLVVFINLPFVAYWRGCVIDHERVEAELARARASRIQVGLFTHYKGCIPPWEWTADKWRETWPWK
jgi:hypothetical protein